MRWIFIVFIFFIFSCKKQNKISEVSFYHWTTSSKLTSSEKKILDELEVQKLYYRYFDVDGNSPVGVLTKASDNPFKKEIVPCIFITNRTFKNIKEKDIVKLAHNVFRKISEMHPYLTSAPIKTIQFDCDWTESTEKKYFQFLEESQKIMELIEVTSTIRLHQLTRIKEGQIPPIKSGTLMIYNTSDLRKMGASKNSILDINEVEKYIKKLKTYPISLDIAVPIYAWAVSNRNGRYNIKEGITEELFLAKAPKHLYEKQDGLYKTKDYFSIELEKTYYFSDNEKIKFEKIGLEQLKGLITLCKEHINKPKAELIFYHLNSTLLKQLSIQELKSVL